MIVTANDQSTRTRISKINSGVHQWSCFRRYVTCVAQ